MVQNNTCAIIPLGHWRALHGGWRASAVVVVVALGDRAAGRHLDDAGLIDDAGTAVTLLNDANDPGLLALASGLGTRDARHRRALTTGLHLRTEPRRLLTGQTDQQTTYRTQRETEREIKK